jgi:hypothetical protein
VACWFLAPVGPGRGSIASACWRTGPGQIGPADRRANSFSMRRRSAIVAHQPPPTVLLNHQMYLLGPITSRVPKAHLIPVEDACDMGEELDVGPGTLLGRDADALRLRCLRAAR